MGGAGSGSFPLDGSLPRLRVELANQFAPTHLLNPADDPPKLFATDFSTENHDLAFNVVSQSFDNDRMNHEPFDRTI
ncbi:MULTISPECIES: hypothetical protein [unclassified Nitrobacter]|uniref:hypothetical protein n=1 Tax=unclassified Nitrobacter TaxID=2620411 RepID=UPI000929D600|nr:MULTISPECIES: hypothetical protein [unclassified Nitrobacter]MBN9147144.1 hypothetical protein [Nitrobacter sp.]OJV02463.1 MAG: hypothetical protein BGO16_02065 [Nitrobacter sp. 62-23]